MFSIDMTDSFIVYTLLLVTIIIGLRAGRGIKDITEYALGNRSFGTMSLVLTFLATNVAGESILDLAGEVNRTGIMLSVVFIIGVGGLLTIQALFIAPNIVRFNDSITMGDIMGTLYGTNSKIITGILGFFTAVCVAGMEVVVLGLLCEWLLGIDYRWGVGVGGLLLAIYSAHGGIKSVTATDVFQFLVLLIVLPMVTVIALKQAGGIKTVLTQVPTERLQITHHPRLQYYLVLLLCKVGFQFDMIDPALIQRFLMARSRQQLRVKFFILAVFSSALYLTIMLTGLSGAVLYPDLSGVSVIPTIINNILPVGIKGLAIAGLIAVTMATIDSFLHAAGLTLTHDIIKPLCDRRGFMINELKWAQYATVFVSLFAIVIGFNKADDLYEILLISYEFTCPILAFPLWGGIIGLKPDKNTFYVATSVTVGVLLLTRWLLPEAVSYLTTLISVSANGVVFLGMHIAKNRGFVLVSRKQTEYNRICVDRQHKSGFWAKTQKFIPTPKNIILYSRSRVTKYGASYMLLGLFSIVNYIVPYFMWDYDGVQAYDLMLYLRFLGALLCGLILVKDKWPDACLPYLPAFWHLTLLYCLPFVSTVMFLLTAGSVEWLINVAITIMFLIVLVDWVSFVILAILGVSLGVLFYQIVVGPINLQLDFSTGYLLVYQAIFATLIGLLFARRKQQHFDKLSMQHQALVVTQKESQESLLEAFREKVRIIQTLRHVGIQDLLQVIKLIRDTRLESLSRRLLPLETANRLEATLIPMALQLRSIEAKATNFLRLSIKEVSIDHFLDSLQTNLVTKGYERRFVYHRRSQVQKMTCDPKYLKTLLMSSITALQKGKEDNRVGIGVEDTQLYYALPSVRNGYNKKIAALRFTVTTQPQLPELPPYYIASLDGVQLSTPETAQELVKLENRRIVHAHYGYMYATSDTCIYVLPVALEELRPKDLDAPYMELGVVPIRADDRYPGAKAQEQAFLHAVQTRSRADIELVKSIVELIKWYHGPVKRQTGEPFYLHPIAVAQIVLDYNQEEATILAALLHDTVEDTAMLLTDIEAVFGKETAHIVDKVTHLESKDDNFYKIKLSAEENIWMLLESGDHRPMYVKIADRMHNMRTITGKSLDSQTRIAKETLQFFVPQAQRLGLEAAAAELKERSWKVIDE